MASRFEINDAVTEAAQSRVVRQGIARVADAAFANAMSIAEGEGLTAFARGLRREDGTRPGSEAVGGYRRPFSRVIAASEDAEALEHGDGETARAAVLARAVGRG